MCGIGITSGCLTNPLRYCPLDSLLRRQMAVFIIRAWSTRLWNDPEAFRTNAPPSTSPYFTDVTDSVGDFTFQYIQKMWELGITSGCTAAPRRFCPDVTVENYQIAVFITRTRVLADGACSVPCNNDAFTYNSTPYFPDVPSTDPYFKWIQRLADLGAVSVSVPTYGCSQGLFCPYGVWTSRGDMSIQVIAGIVTWSYWNNFIDYSKL